MYHGAMFAMLLLAAFPAPAPPLREPTICEIAADSELLMAQKGKRLTVTGRFDLGTHYNAVRPDACEAEYLPVGFTEEAYGQIHAFMLGIYPGPNVGGGWMWGTFSGEVKVRRVRSIYYTGEIETPYLEVDTVAIDPVRRMTFGN